RPVATPAREGQQAEALDEAHQDAERVRARTDDDRGSKGNRLRQLAQQDLLDLEPRAKVRRHALSGPRRDPAEVDRALNPRAARRPDEVAHRHTVAVSE